MHEKFRLNFGESQPHQNTQRVAKQFPREYIPTGQAWARRLAPLC